MLVAAQDAAAVQVVARVVAQAVQVAVALVAVLHANLAVLVLFAGSMSQQTIT